MGTVTEHLVRCKDVSGSASGVTSTRLLDAQRTPYIRRLEAVWFTPDIDGSGSNFSMALASVEAVSIGNSIGDVIAQDEVIYALQRDANSASFQNAGYVPLGFTWHAPLWVWFQNGAGANVSSNTLLKYTLERVSEREFARRVLSGPDAPGELNLVES